MTQPDPDTVQPSSDVGLLPVSGLLSLKCDACVLPAAWQQYCPRLPRMHAVALVL